MSTPERRPIYTAPPVAVGMPPSPQRRSDHRRFDLILGILVGIVFGLAVLSAFVFLGSEGTIDAPRISGVDSGKPAPAKQAEPEAGQKP